MGSCFSDQNGEDSQRDTKISAPIQTESKILKVLLLGAGESGKSTIFKQMKIIHDKGFTDSELKDFRYVVFANVIKGMKTLVESASNLNLTFNDEETKDRATRVFEVEDDFIMYMQRVWNDELCDDIQALWRDPVIQAAFDKRSHTQLDDSTEYYLNSLERIRKPDYIPTEEDVLWARVKTTGIIEVRYPYGDKVVSLVDVGGQRNERKKWINCFVDVDIVVFVVSLIDYNLKCYEDGEKNRMSESLELFEKTVNSAIFSKTPVLLLLNKTDLFKHKIKRESLKTTFPEYDGPEEYDPALKYINNKFTSMDKSTKQERTIYTYPICAMQKEVVQETFDNIGAVYSKFTSVHK
ncbi:guanine nucleotide-binding protein G(i) subunit alpha [Acrasis kona]|uniref:Guanine nucleotide-binding protein G(I) subunit alpha n=1 Tax=Acrasis kona TaxID=1008807 RepID=A0AAW2Z6T9_9EUKA